MRLILAILCALILWLGIAFAFIKVGPFNCQWNREVCSSSYCYLNRSRGAISYLSVSCSTRHIFKSLMIHLRVFRKRGEKYEIYLINTQQDLCNFRAMYDGNLFVRHIFHLVSDYIKNLKCPLTCNLTATRLPVMFYMTNGLMPRNEYVVDVKLHENNLTLFRTNITFNVT